MRILNWNVKGLGDAEKCLLVKDAILASRPDVVCLQETKLQVVDARKVASFLPSNLRTALFMPACGTSGGLMVAWDENVLSGVEFLKNQFCISVGISSVTSSCSFTLTTVYAPCEDSTRPAFFQVLD